MSDRDGLGNNSFTERTVELTESSNEQGKVEPHFELDNIQISLLVF